jgi:hypothetical protein
MINPDLENRVLCPQKLQYSFANGNLPQDGQKTIKKLHLPDL